MPTCLITGGSGFVGGRLIASLRAKGWTVRALARSAASSTIVAQHGATPVPGSLDDLAALTEAARGCSVVFHVAALFKLWASQDEFEQANVQGTAKLLQAAEAAGVQRFVQIGAAAVVMGDMLALRKVDESAPRQERHWAPYSASKARSEALVLQHNRPGRLETIVLRPPMIWGAGMPMLDEMVATVRAGQFRWAGDGTQQMSLADVDNVCHAAELAARHGRGGQAYFISDDADQSFKHVVSAWLRTRGVAAPTASVPLPVAWWMATLMEWAWRAFSRRGHPPITRQLLRLIGHTFTLDIGKAQRELAYQPVVSWTQGLREMQAT